jgi:hypothetical protein
MNWYASLRIIAFLRRGIVALESLAESQRTLAKLAEDDWAEKNVPKRVDRKVDIGTFDPQAASERWEEQQRFLGRRR